MTRGAGRRPQGAFSGAAGGAPCGDLVRRLARRRARSRGRGALRRRGLRGDDRRRRGGRRGWPRAPACWTRPASGRPRSPPSSAGSRRRAATPPSWPPTPSTARSAPPPRRARRSRTRRASGDRVLVALSGGVDSAVAALLERGRGAEVVAVTLKLWADRHTDGARSCCSPEAVVGARALAHGLGLPHLTLDLEDAFRATVVEGFLRGHEAGRTPNPCVVCNGELRIDAMLALARRVGASALATGHYARVVDDGAGPLLAAPADAAKDQTYMLSALRPESLAAASLSARRPDQAARCASSPPAPGCRWPPSARARTSASSPARASAPSSPGTRACASGPGRSSTARAGSSGATAGTTTSPSASAAGSGSPPASRSTCWPPTRPRTGSWSARARRWPPSGCRFATPCCFATASASTASSCATARGRSAARSRAPPAATPSCGWSWPSRPTASPRARPPA